MRVLLTIPGEVAPKGIRLDEQVPFPVESSALGYLAKALSRIGLEYLIIDGYAMKMTREAVAQEILVHLRSDDIIGVSVLQSTLSAAKEVLMTVRASGFEGPVVLGGVGCTLAPLEVMRYCAHADFALCGEAEKSFPLLIEALVSRRELKSVPGLVYRDDENALHFNKCLPPNQALDALGAPIHYLPRISNTINAPLPIVGSRGCNYGRCTFCSTARLYGSKVWNYRSAESLVQEIRMAIDEFDIHDFFFVDDDFFGPSEDGNARAKDFVGRLRKAKLDIKFGFDCRVLDIETHLFTELREVGLKTVFLGIDAGNEDSLRVFRKGFSIEQIYRAVDVLKYLQINIIPGFILFEPYSSISNVRENMRLLNEIGIDYEPTKLTKRLVAEAGAEITEKLRADNLLTGEYPEYDYIFKDRRTEKLYMALKDYMDGVLPRYRALLARGTAKKNRRLVEEINDSCNSTFEEFYEVVIMGREIDADAVQNKISRFSEILLENE